jgi:short subunit dehydrogenase-like uncharacterized protein
MAGKWMIYGANGYAGELASREAVKQGLHPVLASRDKGVVALARELDLDYRVFPLDAPERLRQGLAGIDLVLMTAGPFSVTSAPMVDACLEQGCHYLDITGEIEVFEAVHARDAEALERGVTLCPGVGFDVIPTDCIAAVLADLLPDATLLRLGFDSRSGLSPGTAKTTVEGLAGGGKVRINGRIQRVPLGWKTDHIDFGNGSKIGGDDPWGDVSTAFYTTGIPNIETYIPIPPKTVKQLKRANWVRPLLGWRPVQALLKKQAGKVRGPDEEKRRGTPLMSGGKQAIKKAIAAQRAW